MKVNLFLLVIALLISGLVFYGFHVNTENLLFSLGSALVCLIYLSAAIAFSSPDAPRSNTMVKVTSGIFVVAALLLNMFFTAKDVSNATYLIVNGVLVCLWAGLVYGIDRAKQ
jgi:hypothetical protein